MDLLNPVLKALCSATLKVKWKQLNQPEASTAHLVRTSSLRAQHRIRLLAFLTETTTSKVSLGQGADRGLVISSCPSWLWTMHNEQHVSLPKLWGITINRGWATERAWHCVQATEVGTLPADQDAVSVPFHSSSLTTVILAYADLAQLHCYRTLEGCSLCQYSTQTVAVPAC